MEGEGRVTTAISPLDLARPPERCARRASRGDLQTIYRCRSQVSSFDARVKPIRAFTKQTPDARGPERELMERNTGLNPIHEGDTTMRFMVTVKSAENAGPPPKALMDAIGKLGEEATKAGTLVETGGLFPSSMGARVRLTRGMLNVTDGPFAESKEVVGGYAVYDVKSKEQAVDATLRFMELHKKHWPGWEGEAEIRRIFDAPMP